RVRKAKSTTKGKNFTTSEVISNGVCPDEVQRAKRAIESSIAVINLHDMNPSHSGQWYISQSNNKRDRSLFECSAHCRGRNPEEFAQDFALHGSSM
ncbi:hypothetical protein GN958_ATG04784, partial [Phytophthora infestans]